MLASPTEVAHRVEDLTGPERTGRADGRIKVGVPPAGSASPSPPNSSRSPRRESADERPHRRSGDPYDLVSPFSEFVDDTDVGVPRAPPLPGCQRDAFGHGLVPARFGGSHRRRQPQQARMTPACCAALRSGQVVMKVARPGSFGACISWNRALPGHSDRRPGVHPLLGGQAGLRVLLLSGLGWFVDPGGHPAGGSRGLALGMVVVRCPPGCPAGRGPLRRSWARSRASRRSTGWR